MKSLASRLAKLEQERQNKQSLASVPVLFTTLSHGDRTKPLQVKHDGRTWEQLPGEAPSAFRARVTAEALAVFKPQGRFAVLALCARHPSLGRDGWMAKHGAPESRD